MARTFQNIRLFATMSALENVLVGQHARLRAGLFRSILRTPGVRREEREAREKARELLEYVGLRPETRRPDGREPVLRRPAPRRDRPRARLRPDAAPARRADRGHEPGGVEAPHRVHAQAARRARPDDPPDRARHEGRDGRLRADHRARPRREDRRGRAGGGPAEPAGDRGLPREAGAEPMALLELKDIHTFYGDDRGPQGHLARGQRGRDRHADRLERRRQVHDAALDLRADAAARGLDPLRRRGDRRDAAAGDRPARASPRRPRGGGSSTG